MIDKFLDRPYVKLIVHILILVAVGYNIFYLVNGWQLYKNNQSLTIENSIISKSLEENKSQNTHRDLDLYKDKLIKDKGYKNIGEEVIDLSIIDQQITDEYNSQTEVIKTNPQKWLQCIFGLSKNQEVTSEQEKINGCKI